MKWIVLSLLHFLLTGCTLDANLSLINNPSSSKSPSIPNPSREKADKLCFYGGISDRLPLEDGQYLITGDFSRIADCENRNPLLDISNDYKVSKNQSLKYNGSVEQAITDGNGGFFVAGDFTEINGIQVPHIAHITSDGSVDTNFQAFRNLPFGIRKLGSFVSLELRDEKLYIGGNFSSINNPYGTLINKSNAQSIWPTENRFNGQVLAANSDGEGGWYIAGSFTKYQGTPVASVIRVKQNGDLDETFMANVQGTISALAFDSATNKVYVAGINLLNSSGLPRSPIAALDSDSGLVDLTWNPDVKFDYYPEITGLAVSSDKVFISGDDIFLDGVTTKNHNLGAFDKSSGLLAWKQDMTYAAVNSIFFDGTYLYVGGDFTKVNGLNKYYLAVFNNAGVLQSWPSDTPNNAVTSVTAGGGYFYIGGRFSTVGGTPRSGLARYNIGNHVVNSWNPNTTTTSHYKTVTRMALDGSTLFVAGDFSRIGNVGLLGVASFDTSAAGSVLSWDVRASASFYGTNAVSTLAIDSSGIFIGGDFASIGAPAIQSVAILNSNTGAAESWNLKIHGGTLTDLSISVDGDSMYLAGSFNDVLGESRFGLASVDLLNLTIKSWNPMPEPPLYSGRHVAGVEEFNNIVYIRGSFGTVGLNAVSRASFAALDLAGNTINWDPLPNALITSMQQRNGILYVGGDLNEGDHYSLIAYDLNNANSKTSFGEGLFVYRPKILVTDSAVFAYGTNGLLAEITNDNNVVSIGPTFPGDILTLSVSGEKMLVGGKFQSYDGIDRNGLAIIDFETGEVSDWTPPFDESQWSISVSKSILVGDTVFLGGSFWDNESGNNYKFMKLNIKTNAYEIIDSDGSITALALIDGILYVGGTFSSIAGQTRTKMAAFQNGQLTSWAPEFDAEVSSIIQHNGILYVGGEFNTVNSEQRFCLASFDSATGALTSWAPNPNVGGWLCSFDKMKIYNNQLFYSGYFANIGGQIRDKLASIDLSTGQANAWHPKEGRIRKSWTIRDGKMYFIDLDNNFASLDLTTAAKVYLPWTPLYSQELESEGDSIFYEGYSSIKKINPQTGETVFEIVVDGGLGS